MRILGLDPGSRHTGWGLVERRGSRMAPRAWGKIDLPRSAPLHERLLVLGDELRSVVEEQAPQVAVLESLFHGVNPRSLIVLAQARGVLLETVARAGLEIHEYSPAEVKSAVTGNGRADKKQLARMVKMVLGLRGKRLAVDTSDALAVAICFGQRARMDRLTARAAGRGA